MKEKLTKFRFAPLILAGVCFVFGIIVRLYLPQQFLLIKILPIASVVLFFGGIFFYGIVAPRDEEEPEKELTEEEKAELEKKEIKEAVEIVKNSMPFTGLYGFLSILMFLSFIGVTIGDKEPFAIIGIFIPGLFSFYYVKKFIMQIQFLKEHKND